MRDKFIFEPNTNVTSVAHLMRQRDIAVVLGANKQSRKLLESIAFGQLSEDLRAASDEGKTHVALHAYEQAHLKIGSWPRIKGSLKLRWRNLRIQEANGIAALRETIGGVDALVGEIYLDHLRFVPLAMQPVGLPVTVYERRNDNSGRHYIMVPATDPSFPNTFVRRFVIRGLNGHNAMELDAGTPIKAAHVTKPASIAKSQPQEIPSTRALARHPVALGGTLSEQQQLLSHTRGWKKRYISTGVGNKPPLSTRGTVFVSLFGNVAVDLAMVPVGKIFDLHAVVPAQMNLGVDPQLVVDQGTGYPATDYSGENYLGMRDVLRTRELVIKGEVPITAIIRAPVARQVLGLAFAPRDNAAELLKTALKTTGATLPFAPPARMELEDFTWTDNKRWFFLMYNTVGECNLAHQAAGVAYGNAVTARTLNTYTFATPAGMVLT